MKGGLLRISGRNALASWNPFVCMPARTDHAIQRVGIRAGNEFPKQSCEDDDGDKEKWNPGEGLSCEEENMEQREDDKHVSEIDLIASLAEQQKRTENARASPVALRCGGDEHAGTDSEKGHVQPSTLKGEVCGLGRKTQNEN